MLDSKLLISEIKKNLGVGIPLTASGLIYSLTSFISTIMVAHLGTEALAASALVGMIWLCMCTFFFGALNSVSTLVSQQYGAKNYTAISQILASAFHFGLLICIPIILLLWFSPYLLQYSHQNKAVIHFATLYLHTVAFSTPGLLTVIILEQFYSAISMAKLSIYISFIEVPLEIALIYILVFGKLGLPAMGIAGVGLGLCISYSLTAIALILFTLFAKRFKNFHVFQRLNYFNFHYFFEILRVGLPIGGMYLIEVGAFTTVTFIVARLDSITLAAHQIAFQFLGFFITIAFSMGQAATVRVGFQAGAGDLKGVHYSTIIGIILPSVIMFFASIILALFPELFLSIDFSNTTPNPQLISVAKSILIVIAFFQFADCIRISGVGTLRGIKDTHFSMWTSIVSFWVTGIPLSYLLGIHWHLGGPGIWIGSTLGITIGTLMTLYRVSSSFSKLTQHDLKRIVGKNNP